MMLRLPGRQRGMTLIVALIMLVLMTLFAMTSFNIGKSSLQVVGNMQQRTQTLAAAQATLEETISQPDFAATPDNALTAPCGAVANTRCFDVNGSGAKDISVKLFPKPTCMSAQVVKSSSLNLTNPADLGCSKGVSQSFGIMGTASDDSLCADTMWEIFAVATDNVTQASATVVQGVTVRVSSANIATSCP